MKAAIIHSNAAFGDMLITDKHINMVKEALPGAQVRFTGNPAELIDDGYNADVLICWVTGGNFSECEDYCKFSTNLKWIHGLSAGIEGVTTTSVGKIPELQLTNTRGIHGIPISEHVLGYILSTLRGFPEIQANQRTHTWKGFTPEEAYGKTIGILGIGAIGREIAKCCKVFGMRVLGVKREVIPIEYADEVYPETEMDSVIAVSDFVVMVLPHTPQTDKLFGMEKFDKMKPGARFINVGRGATVDTDALIAALGGGKPAGAMLDAIDPEPLPPDSPLWDMPQVFISPHMSAQTPFYMDRAFGKFMEYAPDFLMGRHIRNSIDISSYC